MPVRLGRDQFERLVEQAVNDLPAWIQEHMENVYITTAMLPTHQQRRASHLSDGHVLLGLYEGVPLTHRGGGYHLHPPDRITLFQLPLQMVAEDETGLIDLIRSTIIHEIAHHFGYSEDELHRLEPED